MARPLPLIAAAPDLSSTEVAHELRCSLKTVRNLAHAGKLIGYRVGRDWRFTREAVDAFKQPPRRVVDPLPVVRVAGRRGGTLPGWHHFDR